MISTRRIAAVVGLAVGVTGLAAPLASAAPEDKGAPLSPMATLDSLTVSDLPAEYKDALPRPSAQLAELNKLNDLQQLTQVTDLAAPVTQLLPGIQY
ncbi:hypothetical protein OG381_41910 [Streptomyces sp. NBC_00490]|jgi:phage FluMu gp28-like protein|uniref:hypothetical protein n=1 Tax=Streptomyces sp. NBC_00490 TaxID=2903657 RepID=UPI002E18769E